MGINHKAFVDVNIFIDKTDIVRASFISRADTYAHWASSVGFPTDRFAMIRLF